MPDDGARLVGALEAMSKREIGGPRVPAAYGGERREPAALPINARRAIALAAIAEAAVSTKPEKLKGSVPQIVLHVRSGQGTARAATATEAVGAGNVCGFAGRAVPERNVCVAQALTPEARPDAEESLRMRMELKGLPRNRRHTDGAPLSIGPRSRTIPPAIRCALQSRNVGCRFPGCNHCARAGIRCNAGHAMTCRAMNWCFARRLEASLLPHRAY